MTTDLLYLRDDASQTFDATILAIDREAHFLILDSTAFFPTGGHQACDQGRVEKNRKNYFVITNVQMDEAGVVRHYYEIEQGIMQPGETVRGNIHWPRRFQHTQLHTAQHIFSRFALNRLGVKTGRANFAQEGGLAVMEAPLTWEQILVLEDDVNRIIEQDCKVRREIDADGRVTVIIEKVDRQYCGGTHVRSTTEIGMFKITNVRDRNIYYQTGSRARQWAIRMANHALETAAVLKLPQTKDLIPEARSLLASRDQAYQELETWKENETRRRIEAAMRTAKSAGAVAMLFQLELPHLDINAAKKLVKKQLLENNQVWFCITEDRNLLIFSTEPQLNAGHVLEHLITRWGIRGGGNPGFAQGGTIPLEVADPLGDVCQWVFSSNGFQGAVPHS